MLKVQSESIEQTFLQYFLIHFSSFLLSIYPGVISGVRVLYTGDFSREEDRHLMAAELPSLRPDVLIVESTYGIHIHEKKEDREHRY